MGSSLSNVQKLAILEDNKVQRKQKEDLLQSLTDDQLLDSVKIIKNFLLCQQIEQTSVETLLRRGRVRARRKQRQEEEQMELHETEKSHT